MKKQLPEIFSCIKKDSWNPLTKTKKAVTRPLASLLFLLSPYFVLAQLSYKATSGVAYHGQAQMSVAAVGAAGSLTLSNTNLPSGITINPVTGQISWDATVSVGTYTLNVFDGTSTVPYTLNVIPNPDDFLAPKYSGSTVTTVYYTTPNNNFHNVQVYVPTGDTVTQRPVFVFEHGGGFQSPSGGSGTFTESYVVSFCQYMAKCGFVAFAPDYNEGAGHTLPQNLLALKDMDACVNWVRSSATASTYKYNPNFIFVGGGSAGGTLSCNYVNYDGGANYKGYAVNLTNIISEANCWGSSPIADRLYDFANLKSTQIPTFLVHGSADTTNPVQNSIDLNNALDSVGSFHDFWEIAGETHGCPNHIPAISDTMAHFQNRAWKFLYPQTINPVVTPLRLVSFDANLSGTKVNLSWTTASEINTSHFEVERSVDGQQFSMVCKVGAVGNSTKENVYSYSDGIGNLDGIIYYRLKSVDRNGTFTYSSIISIIVKSNGHFSLFPNPVKTGNTVKLDYTAATSDRVVLEVMDVLGRKVLTFNQGVNVGGNTLSLATNGLKAGIYFLTVSSNNQIVEKQRLVVE